VIIDAAVALLVERGFGATTVEAISARSGAAKTTIYRHWPDKDAVLRSAVESIVPTASAPDTGSLHGDLTHFAEDLARILTTPPTSALIPGLVDAAERDPGLARLLAEFTAGRRQPVHDAVTRAVRRGEINANTDPEAVAEQLLGPLFYRRLLSRRPLTAELIEHTVETVEHVLAHQPR
jgi:AcrR family transcriptional regulator